MIWSAPCPQSHRLPLCSTIFRRCRTRASNGACSTLPEILLLVLCATLCGMEDFVEIPLWGDSGSISYGGSCPSSAGSPLTTRSMTCSTRSTPNVQDLFRRMGGGASRQRSRLHRHRRQNLEAQRKRRSRPIVAGMEEQLAIRCDKALQAFGAKLCPVIARRAGARSGGE